jgi:hypothetical protein
MARKLLYGQSAEENRIDLEMGRRTSILQMSMAKRKRMAKKGYEMYDYLDEDKWGKEHNKTWKAEAKSRRKKVVTEGRAKKKEERAWEKSFKKMTREEQKAEMVNVRAKNAQKKLLREKVSKENKLKTARNLSKLYSWEGRLGQELSDSEVLSYAATPFDDEGNRQWSPEKKKDKTKGEKSTGLLTSPAVSAKKSGGGDEVQSTRSQIHTKLKDSLSLRRKSNESKKASRDLDRAKSRLF